MIAIEMDTRTAAAVFQVLYKEQENYTLDEATCPPRVADIRKVIIELDKKLEESQDGN